MVLQQLGCENAKGMPLALVRELRGCLREAFGISVPEGQAGATDDELQAWLFKALLEHAEDPEVEVPKWLAGETPLGIVEPVPACGIFPTVEPGEAKQSAAAVASLWSAAKEGRSPKLALGTTRLPGPYHAGFGGVEE